MSLSSPVWAAELASGTRQIAVTHRPRIAVVTPNFPNSADPYLAIYNYHAARALQRWADVVVYCVIPSYPRYRGIHFA